MTAQPILIGAAGAALPAPGPVTDDDLARAGFQPLGYAAAEGVQIKRDNDNDLPFRGIDDSGEWIAECVSCPPDVDKKYGGVRRHIVAWSIGHRSRIEVEHFAEVHRINSGHHVDVLRRMSFSFQLANVGPGLAVLVGSPPDPWAALLRLGDAGDHPLTPDTGCHHRDDRCRMTHIAQNWRDRDGQRRFYAGAYWRRWL